MHVVYISWRMSSSVDKRAESVFGRYTVSHNLHTVSRSVRDSANDRTNWSIMTQVQSMPLVRAHGDAKIIVRILTSIKRHRKEMLQQLDRDDPHSVDVVNGLNRIKRMVIMRRKRTGEARVYRGMALQGTGMGTQ